MQRSIAIFVALLFLSTVFGLVTLAMVYRLADEQRRTKRLRWLLNWWLKGFLLPLVLWVVMNLGISWNLQPFMPEVQAAQAGGGPWFPEFLRVVGEGLFIVSSYWAAVTLIWTVARASRGLKGEPRSDFKGLCLTCCIGMFLPALGIVFLGGWAVVGFAATAMVGPIAGCAPGIVNRKKPPPMYASALARVKFGKYREAELVIIKELEKSEDDFEGWMMLADLYANQFGDLPEAEQTVLEICDQPRTTPSQISIALHRLADWHLKVGHRPEAARRALQAICDRLPNSHLAHMAQLRLNQLPANAEELREQQSSAPIPMPVLGDQLDEPFPLESGVSRQKAADMANGCVEKLKEDPNNVAAREKLSRLFAERLGQPDLGIEQVMLLLNMPEQPDAKRAEWLSWAAAWHIRYREDPQTGRNVLERLIREFPDSPQALSARRRIRLIDMESAG
jgi:hypothetical protein